MPRQNSLHSSLHNFYPRLAGQCFRSRPCSTQSADWEATNAAPFASLPFLSLTTRTHPFSHPSRLSSPLLFTFRPVDHRHSVSHPAALPFDDHPVIPIHFMPSFVLPTHFIAHRTSVLFWSVRD
ncbi:hypothetical protein Mapa_014826 [Marchantia paleacea]|nr:hypothetical protein Mapa_014826 [Marchantia paleacea]